MPKTKQAGHPKHIYLIGMSGVGKTSVGLILSQTLDLPFYDTDDIVEAVNECKIGEIFAREGESHFRELETNALLSLQDRDAGVVSTGGGLPVRDENWQQMKSTGTIVYLHATASEIIKRVAMDREKRPLLKDGDDWKERIQAMFKKRDPTYQRADHIIQTENRLPNEVVGEIVKKLQSILGK
jgi:shikimate kinase